MSEKHVCQAAAWIQSGPLTFFGSVASVWGWGRRVATRHRGHGSEVCRITMFCQVLERLSSR